ncbi:hypothetical protein [Actinokineospora sp.]|uniref:hypothetical protein n=1 Tax=Actinokineospora sp. TaxID=1872133 RepID=UPI004037AA7D
MATRVHPGDHERFEIARDRLVNGFVSWVVERGADADPFVAEVALDYRYDVAGEFGGWAARDVRVLMTDWFPCRVTMAQAERPRVLATLHELVDFLALRSSGDEVPVAELHTEIDRQADAFESAMVDERNFGLAKFWATRMAENLVDPQNEDAVRRFLTAVDAGEIAVDQEVLAEIDRRRSDDDAGDAAAPPLPLVLLASTEELVAAAAASPMAARVHAFVTWVGAGRAATDEALAELDVPELPLVVAWAKAGLFVRVEDGQFVPIESSAGFLDRPRDLWQRTLSSFDAVGRAVCPPTDEHQEPMVADVFPAVVSSLWLTLYTSGGAPVPVELLAEIHREVMAGRVEDGPVTEARELRWRRDLTRVIEVLESLGAFDSGMTDDPVARERLSELSGNDEPDMTLVWLTPLGMWGVREILLTHGIAAPAADELAGEPIDAVGAALLTAPPELAEVGLAAWVEARDPGVASVELAEFCARAPSPSLRLLALTGLARTGDPGVAEAHRLRAAGGLVGAVATAWLVRHSALDDKVPSEDEMLLAFVDNFAALHEHDLLIDELTTLPVPDQLGFVRVLVQIEHADRFDLLDVIAADHPDTSVASEAREALRGLYAAAGQ